MNTLTVFSILAVGLPSTAELLHILIIVAIAAVVIAAIIGCLKYCQIPIAQPVWIILGAFVSIGLILVIAKVFGLLL